MPVLPEITPLFIINVPCTDTPPVPEVLVVMLPEISPPFMVNVAPYTYTPPLLGAVLPEIFPPLMVKVALL